MTDAPNTTASDILSKSVCLSLSTSRFSVRRRMGKEHIETKADKAMIHVGKDILDSSELRAILYCDNDTRFYLDRVCLPAPMFKSGVYLLPIELMEETFKRLDEFQARRVELIAKFREAYPTRKTQARKRLGPAFDPTDYPPIEELEKAFSFEYNIFTFDTPKTGISKALFNKQREKLERVWSEAAGEIRDSLRVAMGEVVAEMTERMTGQADGKKRRFKDAYIANVTTFLDTVQARNLTNDTDLTALVEKARKIMKGISADDIRDDDKLRADIGTKFGEIKDSLGKMMEVRPARKVTLKDEI